MLNKLPIVAVLGSGCCAHEDLSNPLGEWLGSLDVHLLTGGGLGVMKEVAKAFCKAPSRRGLSIGIIPSSIHPNVPKNNYPNAFVELPIYTHLPDSGKLGKLTSSRNHINILSANVCVALPGHAGTLSEIELAIAYKKDIICFTYPDDNKAFYGIENVTSEFEKLKQFILERI